MSAKNLQSILQRLGQGSIDSVQNGNQLSDLDAYMHVSRPIEVQLKLKMQEIDAVGGGIVLLIGSAGDGKSHMISCIKREFPDTSFCFYNDATVSCSPKKTAIDTLKDALVDFNDRNLEHTRQKLVLAINLGKLNAFIDDHYVKESFKKIINVVKPIFDDDDLTDPEETDRIKTVLFPYHQIYEMNLNDESDYPLNSKFLSAILDKIVEPTDRNPFYKAYTIDQSDPDNEKDPLLINYKLLSLKEVRENITKYIIEAIIRYKLIITPREYLDFIYSILYYRNRENYKESKEFYEALLPNLLFTNGNNPILKAMQKLDPLKFSSTKHDNFLSVLFTSTSIPEQYFCLDTLNKLPVYMIKRTNHFYDNKGKDIERTTKFVFRLKHLLSYHSESRIYKSYLNILQRIFNDNKQGMNELYNLVSTAIPRHYGSYYGRKNMIPLTMQGGSYKLFSQLDMKPQPITTIRKSENEFLTTLVLSWVCNGKIVKLQLGYQLFDYIKKLNDGRLAISYENDKNITFSRFIRELASLCNSKQEITILTTGYNELLLSEQLGSILLQS